MEPDFSIRDEEIYLDNAATTIIDEEVVASMIPYLEERYGNPETPYHLGREAQDAVDVARGQVSGLLGCAPDEIYFTSGGTESNNWAIKGFNMVGKSCIVTSQVEHLSVLNTIKWLTKCFPEAYTSCFLDVDKNGVVDLAELENEVSNSDVGLVSIQHSNNETGTIQPIREIAALCAKHGAVFHCDACQSYGKMELDVDDGYDLLSMSAHKIHGPMGIGALYVKSNTPIEPLIHGGGHEGGMRSGTLPVSQIVGFGKAAQLAYESMKKHMPRLSKLVDRLAHDLEVTCGAVRNGSESKRLPNILNVSIPNVDAPLLVGVLNKDGICISTGSACQSKHVTSSVLEAMGKNREARESAVRISLSRYTTEKDIIHFVAYLQRALKELPKRDIM